MYLIRKRITKEKPVCIFGQECHQVLWSKYNKIFGIHNDVAGLAFYIFNALIAAFLVIGIEPVELWNKLAKIFILVGAVTSLYLVYIQWQVIKIWCFWCLVSAITVFLMAIIILANL